MKNKGTLIFFLLLIGSVVMLTFLSSPGGFFAPNNATKSAYENSYGGFLKAVKDGKVQALSITQNTNELNVLLKNSKIPKSSFPSRSDLRFRISDVSTLNDEIRKALGNKDLSVSSFGFTIETQPPPNSGALVQIVPYLILIGATGLILFFFIRQQNKSNNKAMGFGKIRQGPVQLKQRVTFNDVAGADEEKEELHEIVDFLSDPQRYIKLGARIPKGVLLVGPPGTGKTLLARAVAGEAGVPFFSITGSDFVEMFVGVGASRVRDLFEKAKRAAPCIIFIDEIDAVGRHRGSGLGGGHDEREQTLNQLLTEMDGFSHNEGVIVMAATNRVDILDPALMRPGRFDRRITVHYPDSQGRQDILKVHTRGKPLAQDVDLAAVARMTPFFTGADLENVMNEAALLTARLGKTEITMALIHEAIDRVEMGPEKKSRKIIERDRKVVAVHEAGHAVVAHLLEGCDPVKLVTIIPRGDAGGYTQTVPEEESYYISRSRLMDRITLSMGGHAAELAIFNDVSTGATSDLRHATHLARKMITEYGMSDNIGPVYLGGEGELFVGRDITTQRNFSEEVAARIDRELHDLLGNCYERAQKIIRDHLEAQNRVVDALLQREKLTGEEFDLVMRGESLPALA